MRMNLFIILLLLLFSANVQSQTKDKSAVYIKKWYQPFKTNAFDKEGEYHGRWKIYINNEQDLIRNGRFRHGKEVGTWRYYYPGGGLYMIEKYKRGSDNILIRKYHENGQLGRTGQARIIRTPKETHYYWDGLWQVYDEKGKFTHTETYVKGKLLKQASG